MKSSGDVFFTESEVRRAACCIGTGTVSLQSLRVLIGMGAFRARTLLTIIGAPEPRLAGRDGKKAALWRLHRDWEARATAYLQDQGPGRLRGALGVDVRRRLPAMPVYPSEHPHHYETDWLGRVIYVGPERQDDGRWSCDEDAA